MSVKLADVVAMPQVVAEVSEDAIALQFVRENLGRMKFDHDHGRWFEWDGVRWKPDRTDRGLHYARQIGRRMGEGKGKICKASVASGAERFCRADPDMATTSDGWDQDLWKIGTPKGVVNLRTGELLPPDPVMGITKLMAVSPKAGPAARWVNFLNEATGSDKDVIRFLQQWCGYCLTGDTREHSLLFVYGGGGNGKSVFINTLTKMLGDYAVTAAMDTFTASRGEKHSTDVAMLRGARCVTASETEEGKAWAEARIKQMTGADPVTARFMRRDNFTYIPQFKLTIVGNHQPVMHNVDEAMRRRFRIVPFERKPEKPDRQLEDKLREEWPEILQWMIEGCLDWQGNGLSHPAAIKRASEAYFDAQDVPGQWFSECCDLGNNYFEPVAHLYENWSAFAKASGEEIGSLKRFSGMLQKRNLRPDRQWFQGSRVRVFKGIQLKQRRVDPDHGY